MARPRWYLDELATAGPEHLDGAYVAGYDRKAGTDWTGELALLRDLGLGAASTLVDLGAGTGTFALAAEPPCRRVVAVDVSPAMLAVLRDRAARAGLHNVECLQSGFLSYEHQGEPADVVYSRNALHHLPEFWKAVALQRVAVMLKPGGVLRLRDFFSFAPAEADRAIETWLVGAAERPQDGWTRAEREVHLARGTSTFSWLLEPMLERAGFTIRRAEYSASQVYAAYVCVKA